MLNYRKPQSISCKHSHAALSLNACSPGRQLSQVVRLGGGRDARRLPRVALRDPMRTRPAARRGLHAARRELERKSGLDSAHAFFSGQYCTAHSTSPLSSSSVQHIITSSTVYLSLVRVNSQYVYLFILDVLVCVS